MLDSGSDLCMAHVARHESYKASPAELLKAHPLQGMHSGKYNLNMFSCDNACARRSVP